jgi:hypothetical protein
MASKKNTQLKNAALLTVLTSLQDRLTEVSDRTRTADTAIAVDLGHLKSETTEKIMELRSDLLKAIETIREFSERQRDLNQSLAVSYCDSLHKFEGVVERSFAEVEKDVKVIDERLEKLEEPVASTQTAALTERIESLESLDRLCTHTLGVLTQRIQKLEDGSNNIAFGLIIGQRLGELSDRLEKLENTAAAFDWHNRALTADEACTVRGCGIYDHESPRHTKLFGCRFAPGYKFKSVEELAAEGIQTLQGAQNNTDWYGTLLNKFWKTVVSETPVCRCWFTETKTLEDSSECPLHGKA